jgi:DNA-binding transcriptional regulator YhcF (GntR family)
VQPPIKLLGNRRQSIVHIAQWIYFYVAYGVRMGGGVRGTWVQTERKAHEAWAALIGKQPKAAQLLHLLVANMDKRGAVIVSQKVLAEMMGVHRNTVRTAIQTLESGNWIDSVRIGSEKGGVKAYIINRRVAWADKRENQRFAVFDARVIASSTEQDFNVLDSREPLRQLPNFGEIQMPVGDGLPPPNQPTFEGLEPDLPAVGSDEAERVRLEQLGQKRLI